MLKKLIIATVCLVHAVAFCQIKQPKLIVDGMVIQRHERFPLWGYAQAGDKITVTYKGKQLKAITNPEGIWEVTLNTGKAGGPYDITISADDEIKTIKNVLIGDVYVTSGQSNMELPMYRVAPLYSDEMETANYPHIRYFEVPQYYDFQRPKKDLPSGNWVQIDTSTISKVSAVAYFFAKEIHTDIGVPVGIINSALGGSPIESWLDEEALKSFPIAFAEAQQYKNQSYIDSIQQSDRERASKWYSEINATDTGLQENWKTKKNGFEGWNTMNIPGYWADTDLGAVNGVVWFTKTFEVPSKAADKEAKVELGRIVDADSVFVNGEFIGNTTYQYPPRWYTIPADVLKEGKNRMTIRIINEQGRGGFVEDKPYELRLSDDTINLKGEWKYKLGAEMPLLRSQTFIRWKATGLYNAMMNPLIHYPISGILWYQGESNVRNATAYDDLIKTMITDWRKKWNDQDLPFLAVQLANYLAASTQPTDSDWAVLRESQASILDLENTALAVAIDVGEWNDIHPLNKQAVGHRLALGAKKMVYDQDIVYSGPKYKSHSIKDGKVRVKFETFGSDLKVDGKELNGFAIAGADGKFYWADAQVVSGNTVMLKNDQVAHPKYIRYAWADNPDTANLYNEEGLPTIPFRTDK